MKTTYEPLQPGVPVKFTVQGFPQEELMRQDIENFYRGAGLEADRKFIVRNVFGEPIFTGNVNDDGQIEKFDASERPSKI